MPLLISTDRIAEKCVIIKKGPKCSKDFWQALSEFYFENDDLRDNKFMHPRVFDGADFIGDHEKTVFFFIT